MRKKRLRLSLLLCVCMLAACTFAQAEITVVNPTADEYYAINLFLSNFSEVGVGSISATSSDKELVDFAHDHQWFNSHGLYEFGEYFNGNNCRVSDASIQSVLNKYFDNAPQVDLSQTRFDYRDGYYYHQETGGWGQQSFALVTSVCRLDNDTWFVSFAGFGAGEQWTNEDLRLSLNEACDKFGTPNGCGSALVRTPDLSDRATYKMISYAEV